MRVIVLNDHAWPFGGAARVALTSARALAEHGHEVHFIGGRSPAETVEVPGVHMHLVDAAPIKDAGPRAVFRGLWSRKAAATLESIWQTGSVVHIHDWSKLLTSSVVRRALDLGAPTVMTLHDYVIACPNAGFYDYPTATICPLAPMSAACVRRNCDRRSYSHKLWRVMRAAVQRTVGRTHDERIHFVAVTRFEQAILRRWLPPTSRIDVIANPIDAPPSVRSDPSVGAFVLFVGALNREKGPELLAEAARQACVPCVFIGDGEQSDDLGRRYPMHDFRGRLPAELTASVMASAALVVVPSMWYETQNLVAWEAAARGVPVIAPSGTAPGAFVTDASCGRVFERGSVASLRSELEALWSDASLRAGLGANGRGFVDAAGVSIDAHVRALETLYADASNEQRERHRRPSAR